MMGWAGLAGAGSSLLVGGGVRTFLLLDDTAGLATTPQSAATVAGNEDEVEKS